MFISRAKIVIGVVGLFLLSLLIAGLVLGLTNKNETESRVGAIVTNGIHCTGIGAAIFRKGGNIADSTVATMICEGISNPHSSGLGGGFLITIYIKEKGTVESIDAREVAPKLADKYMYNGNLGASSRGGLAIAVPGEVKGLWELHQKYGKLPWRDLIQPNIELCREGHRVSSYQARIFKSLEERLLAEPTLKDVFINPLTGQTWNENDLIKRNKLADTLEVIATEGADAIYNNGSLTKILVDDIRSFGGIITEEDFMDYNVRWRRPESAQISDGNTLFTSPLPGTGSVLTFILNILSQYEIQHDAISYHRIAEAFKFGYGSRTRLGDEPSDEIKELVKNLTSLSHADYIRSLIDDEKTFNDNAHYGAIFESVEDHGTTHICILAPNGDAVSATNTVNDYFGSFKSSAGIILNDEMDDFGVPGVLNVYDLPPSPANFIQPGKKPLSSMTPTIVLDKNGDVRMIVGGAGGARITTGVANAILSHLFLNQTLEQSINAPRLHHQIAPMLLQYETGFDLNIINELQTKYGHNVVENFPGSLFSTLTAISNQNGTVEGAFDPRRGGSVIIF